MTNAYKKRLEKLWEEENRGFGFFKEEESNIYKVNPPLIITFIPLGKVEDCDEDEIRKYKVRKKYTSNILKVVATIHKFTQRSIFISIQN